MGGSNQGKDNRAVMVAAITEKPGNLPQLQKRTGLAKTTVWRWVKELHDNDEVHITGWTRVREGGPFKATYSIGKGDDLPCSILPYSEAQKSRRFQKKKREEKAEFRAARDRAAKAADLAAQRRDPMIEALFGPKRPAKLEAA